MSPTPEQLDNLEALAKAATPGPWPKHPGKWWVQLAQNKHWTPSYAKADADAAYLAALSPDVVKALTAEVRELRSWQGAARAIMDACDNAPDDCPSCRYVVVKRQEARL